MWLFSVSMCWQNESGISWNLELKCKEKRLKLSYRLPQMKISE